MDNGSTFPYRFRRGKGGSGRVNQAYLLDMVCPFTEMMPEQVNPLWILVKVGGKLRGDPRRSGLTQIDKKSLVAFEAKSPVPQTDSGRLG